MIEFFDIEYIETLTICDVFILLNSVNQKQLIKNSTEWFVHEEMDIEREVNSTKDGLTPRSVNFQRYQQRKKRFKGYGLD